MKSFENARNTVDVFEVLEDRIDTSHRRKFSGMPLLSELTSRVAISITFDRS